MYKRTISGSFFLLLTVAALAQDGNCRHINLDDDWRFHFGHAADPEKDFNYDMATIFSKSGGAAGITDYIAADMANVFHGVNEVIPVRGFNYRHGKGSAICRTENSLAKIQAPAIILKADAVPEVRKTNEDAARVMPKGKLVHIDGAGHNLHHDQLARTVEVLKGSF